MNGGNKLSKFVGRSDGLNFETAVGRADMAMRMIRPDVDASVNEIVNRICEIVGRFPERPGETELRALQGLANEVTGLAGTFGRSDLGEASYCLCELLDLDLLCDRYDGPAVRAHAQTMLLLLTPDAVRAVDRVQMVSALKTLVEHARTRARPELANRTPAR